MVVYVSQAVIVHLPLSNDGFGSDADHTALWALQDVIESAVSAAAVGDLDGDEWGEGECVLYLYGDDADRLFAVIEPLLNASPAAARGYAIKQYGDIREIDLRTARVTW